MPQVYEYELEILVRNKKTTKAESRWITQYAYSPMDAVMQSSFEVDVNEEELVRVIRIHPPRKAIDIVAQETITMIEATMKRITDLKK